MILKRTNEVLRSRIRKVAAGFERINKCLNKKSGKSRMVQNQTVETCPPRSKSAFANSQYLLEQIQLQHPLLLQSSNKASVAADGAEKNKEFNKNASSKPCKNTPLDAYLNDQSQKQVADGRSVMRNRSHSESGGTVIRMRQGRHPSLRGELYSFPSDILTKQYEPVTTPTTRRHLYGSEKSLCTILRFHEATSSSTGDALTNKELSKSESTLQSAAQMPLVGGRRVGNTTSQLHAARPTSLFLSNRFSATVNKYKLCNTQLMKRDDREGISLAEYIGLTTTSVTSTVLATPINTSTNISTTVPQTTTRKIQTQSTIDSLDSCIDMLRALAAN